MADAIIDEELLTIVVNGKKEFEMIFSNVSGSELAAGFLFTQSVVSDRSDITKMEWDDTAHTCRISLSDAALVRLRQMGKNRPVKGSSGGAMLFSNNDNEKTIPDSAFRVPSARVLQLIGQHRDASGRFEETGALHSAGLCTPNGLTDYFEDIGRHNAVDKLAGSILLNQTDPSDKIATLSCRMSLEIIGKIIKTRIPVVISNAAPTLSAVRLAEKAGLTLIGFARENRFNIYTHPERILF